MSKFGIYIYCYRSDWTGLQEKIFDEMYFGPFSEAEEDLVVNDAYADWLEEDGMEVYSIALTPNQAANYHIETRDFWMTRLAQVTEEKISA